MTWIEDAGLLAGEFAVVHSQLSTGIVLDLQGKWSLSRPTPYVRFGSLAEARVHAATFVDAAPDREATVVDHKGKLVELFRGR
jgi:hypothetical protein